MRKKGKSFQKSPLEYFHLGMTLEAVRKYVDEFEVDDRANTKVMICGDIKILDT